MNLDICIIIIALRYLILADHIYSSLKGTDKNENMELALQYMNILENENNVHYDAIEKLVYRGIGYTLINKKITNAHITIDDLVHIVKNIQTLTIDEIISLIDEYVKLNSSEENSEEKPKTHPLLGERIIKLNEYKPDKAISMEEIIIKINEYKLNNKNQCLLEK